MLVPLVDSGPEHERQGAIALSRLSRRNFLVRCCQGASAAALPASLRGLAFGSDSRFDSSGPPSADSDFHLHPHYLAERPLDATLRKVQAGFDDFVNEKYHDQIAVIVGEWSSSLRQSPQNMQAIERVLTANFSGSSLLPVASRLVRPGPPIEVQHNTFASRTNLGRDAFLRDLHSSLSVFSQIVTAEFQLTSIQTVPALTSRTPQQVHIRVRSELVGTGPGFHREQRLAHLHNPCGPYPGTTLASRPRNAT